MAAGLGICLFLWASAGLAAGRAPAEAHIRLVRETVQIGRPIYADLWLCNPTDKPVTLRASNEASAEEEGSAAGVLPLAHVLGESPRDTLQIVSAETGAPLEYAGIPPDRSQAGPITIPPWGLLGVRLDLGEHYPNLHSPGTYYVQWQPYTGAVSSARVKLTVAQLKQAVIETELGNMVVAFEYEVAPAHVTNFIELARNRFYDGKTFHHVVRGMLIHGGCPRGDGTGVRPDGKTIPGEFSDLPHRAGTVSMARKAGDPDSASCQFFISVTRLKEFDGEYTVFGRLIGQESFDTLQRIAQVETDERDRPLSPVVIQTIRIENAPLNRDQ